MIRFGFGRDFFINILCTICGYFPGHFHNFYCQTIRNNRGAARTPKWAVKYGLVKVEDKRGGKHQWAGRYDERLPDSSRRGYGDDDEDSSIPGSTSNWDGRGPEPAASNSRNSGNNQNPHFSLSPWDRTVSPSEVEGGPPDDDDFGLRGDDSRGADPLDNEVFYATTTQDSNLGSRAGSGGGGKKKGKGLKGLLGNRDRYDSGGSSGGGDKDRHERMRAARDNTGGGGDYNSDRSGGGDEYQDEFERELNTGSRSRASTTASAPSNRYDSFDQEGPEDAWSSRGGGGITPQRTGGVSSIAPQRTGVSSIAPQRTGASSSPAKIVPQSTGASSYRSARDDFATPKPLVQTRTGTVQGTKEDDDCRFSVRSLCHSFPLLTLLLSFEQYSIILFEIFLVKIYQYFKNSPPTFPILRCTSSLFYPFSTLPYQSVSFWGLILCNRNQFMEEWKNRVGSQLP